MKLRLTPRAESDLVEIASYLVKRNPQAAQRVEDALHDAFALIGTYPQVGHELRDGVRRLAPPCAASLSVFDFLRRQRS